MQKLPKGEDSSNNRISTQLQDNNSSKKDIASFKNFNQNQTGHTQKVIVKQTQADESFNSYGLDLEENAQQGNVNPKQIQNRFQDKTNFHFLKKDHDQNSILSSPSKFHNIDSRNGSPPRPLINKYSKEEVENMKSIDIGIEGRLNGLNNINGNGYKDHKNGFKQQRTRKSSMQEFTKQKSLEEKLVYYHNQKVYRTKAKHPTHVGTVYTDEVNTKSRQPVFYANSINDLIQIDEDVVNMKLMKQIENERDNENQEEINELKDKKTDTKIQSTYKKLRRSILQFIETLQAINFRKK